MRGGGLTARGEEGDETGQERERGGEQLSFQGEERTEARRFSRSNHY